MMKCAQQLTLCCLIWLASITAWAASDKTAAPDCDNSPRFIFSWPLDTCGKAPRGGTTQGAPVTFDSQPHPGWQAIHAPGLAKLEQDRRAILAMAGPYHVSFDFLETVGFSENFKRDQPYQSWGTEYVYVLEQQKNFISLQHIMVMVFSDDEGNASGPMVMKHWRQDWTYEDDSLLQFDAHSHWQKHRVDSAARKGRWSQAVFHVDDSPRYEAMGQWQHNGSFSTWLSDKTRRPLPRRESSVRDDYQVLEGFNRHTITRDGWVQEEENWKMVTDQKGNAATSSPYLSKELGVARYRRITGFDFSAGDDYMEKTGAFWADVRSVWQSLIDKNKTLQLRTQVDEQPLFMPLFEYASAIKSSADYDSEAGKAFAGTTIDRYIKE